ncbi:MULTISPECIES: LacI family DNA-binding transcriptional regulator [Prauserella salsuginis group]|uniref:LacI family DNA-binding transcriptional regulator n=1 Tax=Prauserella salsuginis TaxID=387889 RepID=A0ABW6G1I4_9PSEU|nr:MULTISPECIES: LacI family DNA-binding transcriptional regulator [Prauserella salsuginis group]MCR3722211.1 transcriptional regulator, LacI family [Prauserella flava]MCR3736209.1 transcriptional regulator, LacI family [Prauserella salsuginis]
MPRSEDCEPTRRPTMADVAARAGVSRQTVSLVLGDKPGPNPHTREHVLRAAEDLGFHADTAAQLLRRARSRQLGVLFTMEHSLDPLVIEGLYAAAAGLDYSIVLSAILPTRGVRQAVDELLGLRCEAIILIGLSIESPSHLTKIARQVPVVEIGQHTGGAGIDSVRTADEEGARIAVDHLIELGHRRIVHVDGGHLPGAADRRSAYRGRMAEHGLSEYVEILPGDYTEESGVRAAVKLLSRSDRPTAVFAANDSCAEGLLHTFGRAGLRVPRDLSIVGYDDTRAAGMSYVDLTTVRQDATAMAEFAVQACAERLDEQRTAAKDVVLTPTLTVRGSTATP